MRRSINFFRTASSKNYVDGDYSDSYIRYLTNSHLNGIFNIKYEYIMERTNNLKLKKDKIIIDYKEYDYYYLHQSHVLCDKKDSELYGLIAGKISNYSGRKYKEKLEYWEKLLDQGRWKEACDETASFFIDKKIDAFILVPSKNKKVYDILRESFKDKLPKAKDLSDLLKKDDVNFRELNSEEIVNSLKLKSENAGRYSNLLIVDDYFSRGETFKGVFKKIFDNNAICSEKIIFVTPGRSHEKNYLTSIQ